MTMIIRPARFSQDEFLDFQRVTGTIASNSQSVTLTFGNLSDAGQCVPLINGYTETISAAYQTDTKWAVSINVFDDAGTVKATIKRKTFAATSPALYIAVTLLEFSSSKFDVNKYHYTSQSTPSVKYWDKTITAVDKDHAFAIVTGNSNAGLYESNGGQVYGSRLTSNTNLRIYTMAASGVVQDDIIAYTVSNIGGAEIDVTHYDVTWTAANSGQNVTVSTITDKDFILASMLTPGVGSGSYPNNMDSRFRGALLFKSDATTMIFSSFWNNHRNSGYGSLQKIRFNYNATIQHVLCQFTTQTTKANTISSVAQGNTIVADHYATNLGNCRFDTADTTGARFYKTLARFEVTSATNVNAVRSGWGTEETSYTAFQVMDITPTG